MNRTEQILKLIVEHFIKTAEPVGSQTLLDTYHLDCSSATIRAEMNKLEKDGFLEKTHTSSGRVPSSLGYSYYVEHLREDRVDQTVKNALATVLDKRAQSVEEVIKQSCEILSNMTNLASVVRGPSVSEEKLVSVQIIPIGPKTVTAVFVTDQGYVENKTFVLDDSVTSEDMKKAVELLNERLTGTSIADIVPKMEAMKPALTDYLVGKDIIYQILMEAFLRFANERVSLYGKQNLLDQKEFAEDAAKLKKLLKLIDDPKALSEVLSKEEIADGVSVNIGKGQDDDDVAIISGHIVVPGGKNTSISLLGPTRMDYKNAMAALDYVTNALNDYFSGNTKKEEGGSQCQKKSSKNQSKPKTK